MALPALLDARPSPARRTDGTTWAVAAAAVVAVLARVPLLGRPPSPDEAGFLLVGAQWHGAGTSLYGDYWVDRPPLLVTIFQVASWCGGLPALRVIGCLAALLVVLGVARLARLLGDPASGAVAAVVAAVLCSTPLLGSYAVNGELLAAPFVVGGLIAATRAVRASDARRAGRSALAAGALAACAVLVKQNVVDVAVFGTVLALVSWRRGGISTPRLRALVAHASGGAAATVALVAGWTAAHGTSPAGVLDAMYPFRVRASHVMATGGDHPASARLDGLVLVALSSGLVLLAALVAWSVLTRRRRSPEAWAVVALMVWSAVSVLLGGSYWHHYLIEAVVPVSVGFGAFMTDRRRVLGLATAAVVASGAVAWGAFLGAPRASVGTAVGEAIHRASQPHDTVVNLYGRADVVLASGLRSPYPQLWSLPVKTLDPDLTELDAVLDGPDAPTWLVTGPSLRSWGLRTAATERLVRRDYRVVAVVRGRAIHLRDGVVRPVPTAKESTS